MAAVHANVGLVTTAATTVPGPEAAAEMAAATTNDVITYGVPKLWNATSFRFVPRVSNDLL